MEAPPSVLLATHWYVPLSFFSAPATRKEPSPRVKKRPASTASESPLLTLREKHFTACHAAGALVNIPPQPSWLPCCKCHLFLPLEPIQYCRIFRQLTEYCSNYDKKIRDKSSPFKQAWQSFFFLLFGWVWTAWVEEQGFGSERKQSHRGWNIVENQQIHSNILGLFDNSSV